MVRPNLHLTGSVETDCTPFNSADEAWIWAVKGMRSRLEGANVKKRMADITKPCEATYIILCAQALRHEGKISGTELKIMLLYGGYSVAPSMLGSNHAAAVPLWRRGIDALAEKMEQKRIIYRQNKAYHYDD